jgi:predicted AAA+ superfamily ATPase
MKDEGFKRSKFVQGRAVAERRAVVLFQEKTARRHLLKKYLTK